MLRALDRWAAGCLLGAGGPRWRFGALLGGVVGGRLVWMASPRCAVATAVASGRASGLPRPPSRAGGRRARFFAAFVASNRVSVHLVDRGRPLLGVFDAGSSTWRSPWVGLLAGARGCGGRPRTCWPGARAAARLALLGKAIPALGSLGRARLSSARSATGTRSACCFAIGAAARAVARRRGGSTPALAARDRLGAPLRLGRRTAADHSRGGVLAAPLRRCLWLVSAPPRGRERARRCCFGAARRSGSRSARFSRRDLLGGARRTRCTSTTGLGSRSLFVLAASSWRPGLPRLACERAVGRCQTARASFVGTSRSACSSDVGHGRVCHASPSRPSRLDRRLHLAADRPRCGGPRHLADVGLRPAAGSGGRRPGMLGARVRRRAAGAGTLDLTHRVAARGRHRRHGRATCPSSF